MKRALTYDDIQLVPGFSKIDSRSEISLKNKITNKLILDLPIISAPMPTVCESDMALALGKQGGLGCIHRFLPIETQVEYVRKVKQSGYLVSAAVGVKGDFLERTAELIKNGVNIILIDVAHGHHINVKHAIYEIKKMHDIEIIAGNIATTAAAVDLCNWGADALRVGIGGGSLCTTRVKTGFGVPSVTCLREITNVAKVPVIADGGIRTSGDMAKAFALGASAIMLGSMLAGTSQSPGETIETVNGLYKKYAGAASLETKENFGLKAEHIEGESTFIKYKGDIFPILKDIEESLKSSLSYLGVRTISEFHPEIIEITAAGINEAKPHLLK